MSLSSSPLVSRLALPDQARIDEKMYLQQSLSRAFSVQLVSLALLCCVALSSSNQSCTPHYQGLTLMGPKSPTPASHRSDSNPLAVRMTLRGGGVVVPGIAWSQREESLLLKVDIPGGVSTESLTVTEKNLQWHEGDVSLDLELFAAVNVASVVKKSDGGRVCTLEIKKASGDWWPKLSSGKTPKNVKVDWATWKDEDEDETEKYAPKSYGMENMGNDFNFDDVDKDDDQWMDENKDDTGNKAGLEEEGMKDEDAGDGADEPKIEEVSEDDATMPDA